MLFKIAWKNIWRNRTRSLVLIAAVALGLWGGLAMAAFTLGMMDQRAKDQIETLISHAQIHHPEFREERKVQFVIQDGLSVLEEIQKKENIVGATGRSLTMAMMASPRKSIGVMASGIMPESETVVTKLADKLVEGKYFPEKARNPILISKRAAKLLNIKLRSKVTLTSQNAEGDMVASAFRVSGLFETIDAKYDEANAFVRAEDLQKMLGQPGQIHEIAILLNSKDDVLPVQAELVEAFPDVKVENWKEISPEMSMMADSMDQYIWIFVGIVVTGLFFGIINTMLMAVLERKEETGMLMAIGMKRVQVFKMIILESTLLSLIGVPLGILFTQITVAALGNVGIDMSAFSEGLAQVGMSTKIYPMMESKYYILVAILVFLVAILGSIYPAFKAVGIKKGSTIFLLIMLAPLTMGLTLIGAIILFYRTRNTFTPQYIIR